MKESTFDELSRKEVISCLDCSRLGYIIDINFDLETARIVSVIVESPGGFFSLFKKNIITIPWECISKIGDDLIIADYLRPIMPHKEQKKESKFRFSLKN